MGDFAELNVWGVFENERHAPAPGFDHVGAMQKVYNRHDPGFQFGKAFFKFNGLGFFHGNP